MWIIGFIVMGLLGLPVAYLTTHHLPQDFSGYILIGANILCGIISTVNAFTLKANTEIREAKALDVWREAVHINNLKERLRKLTYKWAVCIFCIFISAGIGGYLVKSSTKVEDYSPYLGYYLLAIVLFHLFHTFHEYIAITEAATDLRQEAKRQENRKKTLAEIDGDSAQTNPS